MEDVRIVELLWQRVESVLDTIRQKYGSLCFNISFSILRSREDAEECVSDTYMRVWDSVPPNRPDNLQAYLVKITRNLSIDKLRAMTRKKRGADSRDVALAELEACLPSRSVEEEYDDRELAEAINRFLKELPSESRMIFVGRYWSYRTVAELASDFGYSQSKIKSILFRVRGDLRANLELEGYSI